MAVIKGLRLDISDDMCVLVVFGRFLSVLDAYLARFSFLVLRAIESGKTDRAVACVSRKR